MEHIIHCAASREYDILVEHGALTQTGRLVSQVTTAKTAAVITDSNVAPLYAETVVSNLKEAGFAAPLFVFPAGEHSKNHETLLSIYAFLAENSVTRSDIVVALGGGVTGDTAGFAAATYMRGIDFIQIPTTLLAQIDSSVGGKTGVDLKEGKNLVGAFWQPRLVICDPDTLKTLPGRVFTDGMAEAVKYGCICDEDLFTQIENGMETKDPAAMICRCIDIKRGVVERDERESGERMLLNFGHTMGHAIEKAYHYETFTHGEAVAMGMMLAVQAGERRGLTRTGSSQRLGALLTRLGLPLRCGEKTDTLAAYALRDKKRSGARMNIILLKNIGESFIHRLPAKELADFFRA